MDGRDDGLPHLHVVVVDIDAEQRLCVPAYDASKSAVTKLTEQLHRCGIYVGTGWVEIDNSTEVAFRPKWSGKVAKWIPYKITRVEQRLLTNHVGDLSDHGLKQIVECLLKLHAARPGCTLASDELKKIKKLAAHLGARIPAGI